MPSPPIPIVTFPVIPEGAWAADTNPEYIRMLALRTELDTLKGLWEAVVAAGATAAPINAGDPRVPANDTAVTTAYKALKDAPLKIINLEKGVFLGGSRKRRQSKKRKNHKKHNNQ
jgi:hypothetical protein